MSRFRIRNLTVAVEQEAIRGCGIVWSCPGGPPGSYCFGGTDYCHWFSPCRYPTLDNCGVLSHCPGGSCFRSGGCGVNYSTFLTPELVRVAQLEPDRVARAEILSQLKMDFQQALKNLDAVEGAVAADALPQTLEEAEALEANLKGALDEIGQIKKKLKK